MDLHKLTAAERELLMQSQIETLKDIISRQKDRAVRAFNRAIARGAGEASLSYWRARTTELQTILDRLGELSVKQIRAFIELAYEEGELVSSQILERSGIGRLSRMPDQAIQLGSLAAVLEDMSAEVINAVRQGQDTVARVFRAVQASQISEGAINAAIGEGLAGGTVQDIAKRLSREIRDELDKLGQGKFFRVGKRMFTPESYAELVARTRSREAQSFSAIETNLRFGNDLVRASKHNTTTEICKPYERDDAIFSISGKSVRYRRLRLEDMAPYHPNCLHVMIPHVDVEELRT